MDIDPGSKRTVRFVGALALLLLGSGQIAQGLAHHLGFSLYFGFIAVATGIFFLVSAARGPKASSGPQRPDLEDAPR